MIDRIGNCRIVEEIGSGGMAVIYKAVQESLNRTVAIKALKPSVAVGQPVRHALRARGALHGRRCSTRTSCTSTTSIKQDGAMYIVMEYVQGIDLYDLLEQVRRCCRSTWRRSSRCRSRARSTTRTSAASSTATSSRPTS